MELKNIQDKLGRLGYSLYLQKRLDILFCSIEDASGEKLMDSMCQVAIKDKKYICLHFDRNVPLERELALTKK